MTPHGRASPFPRAARHGFLCAYFFSGCMLESAF